MLKRFLVERNALLYKRSQHRLFCSVQDDIDGINALAIVASTVAGAGGGIALC